MASGFALAVSTVALIAPAVAGATTYNNDAPITIPTQGTANPYPSSITVSGTAGPITDVNVGLDGLTHSSPGDVGIVLVAPSGQALALQRCEGNAPAAGVFLTFDDAAAAQLPGNGALTTGTFKPASHCTVTSSFPAPGPLTSYLNPGPGQGGTATLASAFNGLSAIGTWNLHVVDDFAGDSGSIPGGWSLDVNPNVTPPPAATPTPTPTPAPTKKKCKKKKSGGKAGAAAKKKGCKKPKRRSS